MKKTRKPSPHLQALRHARKQLDYVFKYGRNDHEIRAVAWLLGNTYENLKRERGTQ